MSTLISFVRHQLEARIQMDCAKLLPFAQQEDYRDWVRTAGRLCHSRYPLINQHRAGGDADATAILFSRLLNGTSKV
jgi:DNA polymerase-3 subunit epsilon